MHGQPELAFPAASVFSLCERHPLPLELLRYAARLGGRILPIVGGNNTGAEILLQECRTNADSLNWKCLWVKAGPPGVPCRSAIAAIAETFGYCSVQDTNLFGRLPDLVRAANYRLIFIEGASHLSDAGVWEMVRFLEDLSASGKGEDGPPPLLVWHARPNWQQIFQYDDPSRQHFLADVFVPPVHHKTSVESIASVFSGLGQLLKDRKQAWERLLEKTAGRIGLLVQLEDALTAPAQSGFPDKSAGEILNQLLELLLGGEALEAKVKTRSPRRSRGAHLPPGKKELSPPLASRSHR